MVLYSENKGEKMKRIGIVSYNIYGNFTNYGSALQSWAMAKAIQKATNFEVVPVLVDYCPEVLLDKDPLNPFKNMWDQSEEAQRMCALTMPAIKVNYDKFMSFFDKNFEKTKKKYTSENFNDIIKNEELDGFICGSDTIFSYEEFKFDDGYFAEYDVMKKNSVAFAASFGDCHFNEEVQQKLNDKLQNFNAIYLRESQIVDYVKSKVNIPVGRVIDPTLLLEPEEYDTITSDEKKEEKYLLLYSRRYNPEMEKYAIELAKKNNWKIVEISLRATNAEKGHEMRYDAGVEEFLALVKNAEFVVTNSYHGMIFSVQFKKEFVVFSRELCDNKIYELLEIIGLTSRINNDFELSFEKIKYDNVHVILAKHREKALNILQQIL